MFLLEFSMPLTGKKSFDGDMPAIWLTNAQIPLTSQYGTNSDCSVSTVSQVCLHDLCLLRLAHLR